MINFRGVSKKNLYREGPNFYNVREDFISVMVIMSILSQTQFV